MGTKYETNGTNQGRDGSSSLKRGDIMGVVVGTMARELKIQFRSSWTFSLAVLFGLFTVMIMYLYGNAALGIGQYSKVIGTLMNLLSYFIPLMTLIVGSFSFTMEKEDGSWGLLLTYPISSSQWIIGKFVGVFIVLMTIVALSFSVGGGVVFITNGSLPFTSISMLFLFVFCLVALFLVIAVFIGMVSSHRWQALTISVAVWILFVLAWPLLIMATLHSLHYGVLLQVLQTVTFLNPLEFTRIFFVVKMGGGAVFGPEYVKWVTWIQKPNSTFSFIGLSFVWVFLLLLLSIFLMERSRNHG